MESGKRSPISLQRKRARENGIEEKGRDDKGRPPAYYLWEALDQACERGASESEVLSTVRSLILGARGEEDVALAVKGAGYGGTPLCIACRRGHLGVSAIWWPKCMPT